MIPDLKSVRYNALKADYEGIREDHPEVSLKPYDDLTDEERANHEASYKKMQAGYDKMGDFLQGKGPMPSFEDF
jgi:hypothetical protein